MATLTREQIKDILINRPNAKLIEKANAMRKKLKVHLHGLGLADYLAQIETYERPEALALRRQYAKSNKDMFSRVLRPIDKIFSAKGGGYFFDLPDSSKAAFTAQLRNVENGYSSRKWVENFWKPRYFDDPMGLIFMELEEDGSEVYPTYKSSEDVYDYYNEGRELKYLVLRTDDKEIFRVVDDSFDALYRFDGKKVTKIPSQTFPNYFGYVPAKIISDLPYNGSEKLFASPIDDLIELADEFLRDDSVRTIYKFKHGFPKAWKYAEMCGDCKGSGHIEAQTCKSCNGTGKKLDSKVSDIMVLSVPEQGQPTVAPDVAGYVTPDIEYLQQSMTELKDLENLIFQTHWGTHQKEDTANETATGRFIDVQPVNDRLNGYADAAESIETFITDAIGKFTYPTSYNGCSINYGRRFLIESPDAIWKKYEDARQKGAPLTTLDEHLREYLESKYQNNSLELQKYLKQMKVEPFVHLTIAEAKLNVPDSSEYLKKLYFCEWAALVPQNDWLIKNEIDLRKSLADYVASKNLQVTTVAVQTPINAN